MLKPVAGVAFSPRERGWSAIRERVTGSKAVLPARAGVVRYARRQPDTRQGSPRASGGGPETGLGAVRMRTFSPRERGWSVRAYIGRDIPEVLPARAGVVRPPRRDSTSRPRSPRASGGGPLSGPMPVRVWVFSPRERGWSAAAARVRRRPGVLPARAGVVRHPCLTRLAGPCSPRASGGGPSSRAPATSLPRFSPRERGWSGHQVAVEVVDGVLPARAGVVRRGGRSRRRGGCSPRASGGGPFRSGALHTERVFSPRERGWSGHQRLQQPARAVLPARAGVVRPSRGG